MGEKLKGLFDAISNLTGTRSVNAKLTDETEKIVICVNKLAKHHKKLMKEIHEVTNTRDSLVEDYHQMSVMRQQMQSQKESLSKLFKEKTTFLQKKWEESETIKEAFKQDVAKLEKRLKDLSDEYMKLRQKMKQYKFSSADKAEEKICKLCSKIFYENENFNWSCRIHPSEWSGEIYWCCGKTVKDSPGCRTAKHVSKEEDEDLPNDEEKDKLKVVTMMCSVLCI
jgi:hypothetical protein